MSARNRAVLTGYLKRLGKCDSEDSQSGYVAMGPGGARPGYRREAGRMDTEIQDYDGEGVPIGCMGGIAALPFIAGLGVIVGILVWYFPWLLIFVAGWRIGIAVKGYSRGPNRAR